MIDTKEPLVLDTVEERHGRGYARLGIGSHTINNGIALLENMGMEYCSIHLKIVNEDKLMRMIMSLLVCLLLSRLMIPLTMI